MSRLPLFPMFCIYRLVELDKAPWNHETNVTFMSWGPLKAASHVNSLSSLTIKLSCSSFCTTMSCNMWLIRVYMHVYVGIWGLHKQSCVLFCWGENTMQGLWSGSWRLPCRCCIHLRVTTFAHACIVADTIAHKLKWWCRAVLHKAAERSEQNGSLVSALNRLL